MTGRYPRGVKKEEPVWLVEEKLQLEKYFFLPQKLDKLNPLWKKGLGSFPNFQIKLGGCVHFETNFSERWKKSDFLPERGDG